MSFATSSFVSCDPKDSSLEVSEVSDSEEEEDSEEELENSDSELPMTMGLALMDPSLSGVAPWCAGLGIGVDGGDSMDG